MHSTPRLLLRQFADADGRLYYFDKRQPASGVGKRPPKYLFKKDHLYSTIERDGTRRDDLDRFYQKLEAWAAPIAKKMVTSARAKRFPQLSLVEKQTWDLFVYNQWRRVPDCYEKFAFDSVALQEMIDDFDRDVRPLTAAEREYWQRPDVLARFWQNVCVDGLKRQSTRALRILASRGLGVALITKANKSFVTGSHPVVKLANPETPHLSHPSTEMWLALAPDVAVTPAGERGEERIVTLHDDHHIRGMNEALFRQSTQIAGRSKELIISLAGSRRSAELRRLSATRGGTAEGRSVRRRELGSTAAA